MQTVTIMKFGDNSSLTEISR